MDETVLDLGCGIMQATDDMKAKSILGVDVWDKYLNHIKYLFPTCRINMNETDRFMDESFDVVICLDVIEHLEKDLALHIIDECKRICRKRAIIYTPNYFKPNDQPGGGAWNLGDNPHQSHLCLIEKHELQSKVYSLDNPAGDAHLAIFEK